MAYVVQAERYESAWMTQCGASGLPSVRLSSLDKSGSVPSADRQALVLSSLRVKHSP